MPRFLGYRAGTAKLAYFALLVTGMIPQTSSTMAILSLPVQAMSTLESTRGGGRG